MKITFIVDTKGKHMAKGIAPAAAIAAWFVAAATLLGTTPASAASLVEISGFGQNRHEFFTMHVYAPDKPRVAAADSVAIHYCTGTGPAFFSGTEFRTLADRYGFIVIYPSATRNAGSVSMSRRHRPCVATAAAIQWASCRWSLTSFKVTAPTPTGCMSPARHPAR